MPSQAAQLRGPLAKVPCTDLTLAARPCRVTARWTLPGDTRFFCKTHATRRAVDVVGDGRIVHLLTGRIEYPSQPRRRKAAHAGPLPVGRDAVIAELRDAHTDGDVARCVSAVVAAPDGCYAARGLHFELSQAFASARARVKALKGKRR